MAVTLDQANTVLKDIYLDVLVKKIKESNPLFDVVKTVNTDIYDGQVKKICGLRSHHNDVSKDFVTINAPLKNLSININIPAESFSDVNTTETSFLNVLTAQMEQTISMCQKKFSRMFFGNGTMDLTTVVMNNGNVVSVESDTDLFVGMRVGIYNGDETICEDCVITAMGIDENDYTTITLEGGSLPEEIPDTAIIYDSDFDATSVITSFGQIFGDSETLYGVDRSVCGWGNPLYYEQDGVPSFSQMRKMIDGMRDTGYCNATAIICTSGVRRAFVNFCSDNDIPMTWKVIDGVRVLIFDGIPMYAVDFKPHGTMYIIAGDNLAFHQSEDWHWVEDSNGSILQLSDDGTYYTATLQTTMELVCYKPYGQAVIVNIREA